MARNNCYIVSDDYMVVERFKSFCESQGVSYDVYTPSEWEMKMGSEDTSLAGGHNTVQGQSSNVIPFPGAKVHGKVQTINELESVAIENAIHEFHGNLTEASKALGIGRATLYRKVKQYGIDPNTARRKRAA